MTNDRRPSTSGAPGSHRRRPEITLDQLHTFVAVADAEHIGLAADRLGRAQGSVSASVRRLEEALNLPLLHRVGRNVRLTDIGRAVRQLAIRALDEASLVERLATGYSAFELGEITIAAGLVTGAYLLAGWLAPFVQRFPTVDLRIELVPVRGLLDMLRASAADVVIVGTPLREPGIETMVLARTTLVVVAAGHHPLAAAAEPMRELRKHRILAHESGSATQSRALRLLGPEAEELTSLTLEEGALHAALLAGLGFAVMPRLAVERDLADGGLVELPTRSRPVRQEFIAARRRGVQTPAANALWRQLAER